MSAGERTIRNSKEKLKAIFYIESEINFYFININIEINYIYIYILFIFMHTKKSAVKI